MVKMTTVADFISCVSEQFSNHSISKRVMKSFEIVLNKFYLGHHTETISQEEKVAQFKMALQKDRIKDTYSPKLVHLII